jgi:hypothetical protein
VPRWVYQMSSTLRSSKSDEIHWNLHTLPFRLWLKMMISDQVNLAFTIWHLRSDNSLFERGGEISDWHLRSEISDWHLRWDISDWHLRLTSQIRHLRLTSLIDISDWHNLTPQIWQLSVWAWGWNLRLTSQIRNLRLTFQIDISDWHLRSDISDWHLWLTSQIDISDLTHSHSYVIIITSIVWRQMEVEWKGSIKILTVMILQTRIKPSNEASHPLTNPISKSQSKIYRKERTNPDGFLFLTNSRIPLLNTHMVCNVSNSPGQGPFWKMDPVPVSLKRCIL